MKKQFSLLVVSLAAIVNLSAFALSRPGIERPIFEARLNVTGGNGQYPLATQIIMNKLDGAKAATSFTLVEDNGIRCFTTPCPNLQTSLFRVTNVEESKSNTVDYTAEAANGEVLYVVDYTSHFLHPQHKWVVTVDGTTYEGAYTAIFTLMDTPKEITE